MTKEILEQLTNQEKVAKIKRNIGELSKSQRSVASVMQGFSALHTASTTTGALDAKTKELIALAIAVAAQTDGCIALHMHDAMEAGASRTEINDTLSVAILMGGNPSVMYATHVIEAMEQF
ncbi:MAG: AhpD family alkylhydroperoxidase [Granulosicoccus sp.]|jgi:AhpD family alkylhydroperoxidase